MSADYIRRCPTCGKENAPDTLRCACGALLTGVDLSLPATEPTPPEPSAEPAPIAQTGASAPEMICPQADCGQPNPPGSTYCLYCSTPLAQTGDGLSGSKPGQPSLFSLPGTLREHYRIAHPLPVNGGEAELLVVSALSDGQEFIAKIYRHGIHPDPEIQASIARIDPRHRVEIIASGLADGFTYELMEYCRAGSLRDLLKRGQPAADQLREIIAELTIAIADVHRVKLIHRDLKPENILIRSQAPLDLILTDFSIASLSNATLRFTSVARTLAYSAPETLSGIISSKADWWSLGMILLEAASGRHPFTGLSDAVILHALTTRPIDLSPVLDPDLRKLLAGLLLRDPQKRWGQAEIERWLAGDPTLAAAQEESPLNATHPYRIGDAVCHTAEQLAVALAANWSAAVADLDNGQLLSWLRTELKDHNRVRLLIDLNMARDVHADIRLLRLIIDLAPGVPAVWRGDSLDLRNILQHADRALKNDAAAADWLETLFSNRVLDAYAAAGNSPMADIRNRWQSALEQFDQAWDKALTHIKSASKTDNQANPRAVRNFDELMFGQHSGPNRPAPRQLHARLLALAYDPAWATRLRQHLQQAVGQLAIDAPWLLAVGAVEQLPAIDLLALESLLPEARKQSKHRQENNRQAEAEAQTHLQRLQADTAMTLSQLQTSADHQLFSATDCAELAANLERFATQLAEIRALGRSDVPYEKLRKQMARAEPTVNRLRRLLDDLLERRAENRAWFNEETLRFAALAIFVLPFLFGQKLLALLLIVSALLAAWRFLPNLFTQRAIRGLAKKLENP